MAERICSKCGESKPETEEFFRRRGTKDRGGLRPDCRDCSAERDRAYYAKNREQVQATQAAYRATPEGRATRATGDRAYTATPAGRETRRRAVRRYNTSPTGRVVVAMSRQRRKTRFGGTINDFTTEDWTEILAVFEDRCAYCGATGALTQDHVVAGANGGPNTRTNVVPACGSCNSRKFTTDMETWFRAQPYFTEARLARIVQHTGGALTDGSGLAI